VRFTTEQDIAKFEGLGAVLLMAHLLWCIILRVSTVRDVFKAPLSFRTSETSVLRISRVIGYILHADI